MLSRRLRLGTVCDVRTSQSIISLMQRIDAMTGKPIYTRFHSRCTEVLRDDWWSTSITDSLVLTCQLKHQLLQSVKKKVADWDAVQDETIQLFSDKSYI